MKLIKWLSKLSWRACLAGILAGGIIHIVVTLAIPFVAKSKAFVQIARLLPENKLKIISHVTARTQILPFMTPDVRYALCRYNIARGPVRISARLLDPSWTLALYTPQGDNFHITTGLASQRNDVSFDLVPPAPKLLGIFPTTVRTVSDRVMVNVPEKTGLMLLRAPVHGTAFAAEVDKTLQLASCKAVEN